MDIQRFANVASALVNVAILIGIGALASWRGVLNKERVRVVSEVAINLLLPAFAFWHGAHDLTDGAIHEAPLMVGIGLAFGLFGFLVTGIAGKLAHWEWPRLPVLRFVGGLGNTGFLGIPMCAALFGSRGGILALLFDLGVSLVFYAMIIPCFEPPDPECRSGRQLARLWIRRLTNPVTTALVLGVAFAALGWRLPDMVATPLSAISGALVPIMMLTLGAILYQFATAGGPARRDVMLPLFIKMALLPALAFGALLIVPTPSLLKSVIIVQAAMPSGMSAPVFAERFGADEKLASSAVMISTVLSLVTLPLISILLG